VRIFNFCAFETNFRSQKLFCSFSRIYQCYNTQLTSILPDTRITRITGNFDYPFLSEVQRVGIDNATVAFIPDFTLVTKQLPKVKQLFITRSGLKYVERRQLAKMPQLTKLSLYDNLIEHLPENAFNDLVNLEDLWLSDNQIKVLPPKLLWNLPNLKKFAADGNQIELIPRDFFKTNRQLEKLWFNGNKITRIEADFTLLPKLNYLDLIRNTCISKDCNPCNIEKLRQIQQDINRNCNGIA
jgi:Leucine-rich repeat (LRR) protein